MLYRIIQIKNKLKGHDDAFDWRNAICIHAYTFSIFRNFWKQFQIQNFISVNKHTYVYRYVAVHSLVRGVFFSKGSCLLWVRITAWRVKYAQPDAQTNKTLRMTQLSSFQFMQQADWKIYASYKEPTPVGRAYKSWIHRSNLQPTGDTWKFARWRTLH